MKVDILKKPYKFRYCFNGLLLTILLGGSYYHSALGDCLLVEARQSKHSLPWPHTTNKSSLTNDNWISLSQLTKLQEMDHKLVLVDVRSKLEQITTPLEGALIVSLTDLQDKQFLSEQTLVLINKGFDQQKLDKVITKLHQKGFSKTVALYGGSYGLQSYKTNKYMNDITPAEFLMGSKTIHWQVITIGLANNEQSYLPEIPVTNYPNASTFTYALLDKQYSNINEKENTFINFVLVAKDSNTTEQLKQQLMMHKKYLSIAWLQGGLANYKSYIETQQTMVENTGVSLKRTCGY